MSLVPIVLQSSIFLYLPSALSKIPLHIIIRFILDTRAFINISLIIVVKSFLFLKNTHCCIILFKLFTVCYNYCKIIFKTQLCTIIFYLSLLFYFLKLLIIIFLKTNALERHKVFSVFWTYYIMMNKLIYKIYTIIGKLLHYWPLNCSLSHSILLS